MQRRQLLVEFVTKRQMTRQGPIYNYKKPVGPPTGDARIIKFIWDATQTFDLTPIMQGDQQQSRWAAQDYVKHLKKAAAKAGIPFQQVLKRLKTMGPHMRRGLLSFHTYLDARARSGS